jgi:hypothetical protein
MKNFFIKCIILVLPVTTLILLFISFDPFRIIWSYKDYSNNMYIILNRDFVSTEVYKKNKQKYKYDSFIFGSSRTLSYKTDSWRKHLDPSASPFVFDASTESLFGICTKIKYIDKTGNRLKNVLIILDTDCSFLTGGDSKGHLSMKHPSVAGTSWVKFYFEFFKVYLDWDFFKRYNRYLITHKFKDDRGYFEFRVIKFDTITNDLRIVDQEEELQNDPKSYYERHSKTFYSRQDSIPEVNSQITPKQKLMFEEIMNVFKKHNTNYKIVISPLYSQVKFNSQDLEFLDTIFGKENVFDFSGKNTITDNKYNYFESSHYRTSVGDSIMNVIYEKKDFLN